MARELAHIRKRMAVQTVEGKRRLVLNGRTIQTKAEVQGRIEKLDDQIESVLPAAKAQVDGAALKATVEKRIDARIATLQSQRDSLDAAALAAEAQDRLDQKIARLTDVRTVLAEMLGEIE